MKARRIVGYLAVAFAYAPACGGSPAPSISASTAHDGGAADAGANDAGDLASGNSDGGTRDGATTGIPNLGSNASSSGSPAGYCCLSGAYYACANQAALQRCTGFDVYGCLESCPPTDAACQIACSQGASRAHADTSACLHDQSKDSMCISVDGGTSVSASSGHPPAPGPAPAPAPAPAPPPPPTNSCGGPFLGFASCMATWQCQSDEHCSQGKCFPTDVGNPCTFPNDCGAGNHCTNGCCASPAKGSACQAGFDCKSGTCTSGVCQ